MFGEHTESRRKLFLRILSLILLVFLLFLIVDTTREWIKQREADVAEEVLDEPQEEVLPEMEEKNGTTTSEGAGENSGFISF